MMLMNILPRLFSHKNPMVNHHQFSHPTMLTSLRQPTKSSCCGMFNFTKDDQRYAVLCGYMHSISYSLALVDEHSCGNVLFSIGWVITYKCQSSIVIVFQMVYIALYSMIFHVSRWPTRQYPHKMKSQGSGICFIAKGCCMYHIDIKRISKSLPSSNLTVRC